MASPQPNQPLKTPLGRWVRTGIVAFVAAVILVGCSGSSDSGTEGVARWAGTYNASIVNFDGAGQSAGIVTIKSDGSATGSFPTNIAVKGTVDVAGGIRMSGDKTPEGMATQAIVMTGKISGVSAAKKIAEGKVSMPNVSATTTTWTAQCTSGCG